jgi:hypothetical protein
MATLRTEHNENTITDADGTLRLFGEQMYPTVSISDGNRNLPGISHPRFAARRFRRESTTTALQGLESSFTLYPRLVVTHLRVDDVQLRLTKRFRGRHYDRAPGTSTNMPTLALLGCVQHYL